jgi:hypothetical protein
MTARRLVGCSALLLLTLFGCAQLLGVDGDAVLLVTPGHDASVDRAAPADDVFVPAEDAATEDVVEPVDAEPLDAEPVEDAGEDAEDAQVPCDAGADAGDAQDACP